jgi:hypothetical protein
LWTQAGCQNDGTNGSGNVYTYNGFGVAANNFITWGASNYSTYAAWEGASGNCGSGGCSHSMQSDPAFLNTAKDNFMLKAGSPALDAGTNLGSNYQLGLDPRSSWPGSVITLNQNSFGNGWEIGAFVYDPGFFGVLNGQTPAPPTILKAIPK